MTDVMETTIEEREAPSYGDHEVLIEMSDVGICGSDVHFYEHGNIGDYAVEEPLVLGHECAGVVSEVGSAVTGLDPGDRVAIEPGVPCRRCEHCKRGEYQICPHVTFMAIPPHDGAFREQVAWPADYVYPIPDSLTTAEAALCEPLSCGIHVSRVAGVGPGDTMLVAGSGPIGILCMATAREAGATDLLDTGRHDRKLVVAGEMGADRTINVREEDPVAVVEEYTDGRGVDAAVDAVGAKSALDAAIDATRRGGTVVLYGFDDDLVADVDVLDHIVTEKDVRGAFRYADTWPAAISLADERIDLETIVDFETTLDGVDESFRRVMESDVVKGMVSVGD
jgi:L-iditol 2-dehydrogenase